MSSIAAEGAIAPSREVLRAGSRSFHFASLFLPSRIRDAAAELYAFCRMVDDIADQGGDPAEARAQLDTIEAELTGARAPRTEVRALLELCGDWPDMLGAARELVGGVRSDLEGQVRLRNPDELIRYAYRVAGTVGLMMCGVLGVRDRRAGPHAIDLGIAMQLTNIARDVAEDARRGRVYLPSTRLEAAGSNAEMLLALRADPHAISIVTREVLELADRYYASAARGFFYIPMPQRLAIMVASGVYRQIGRLLLERGGNPLGGRTIVSTGRKIWSAIVSILGLPRSMFRPRSVHSTDLHRPLLGLPGGPAGGQV